MCKLQGKIVSVEFAQVLPVTVLKFPSAEALTFTVLALALR